MIEFDWRGPLAAEGVLKTIVARDTAEEAYHAYPTRYIVRRERLGTGELDAEKMHLTLTFLLPPDSPVAEGSLLTDCNGNEYAIAAYSPRRDLEGRSVAILCRVV